MYVFDLFCFLIVYNILNLNLNIVLITDLKMNKYQKCV